MKDPDDIPLPPYQPDERQVAEGLFERNYDTLLTLARNRRKRAGFGDTLQTSDVLHESFLKLTGRTIWQSQEHFLKTASLAMRQVVVDHARRKLAAKRGGGATGIPIDQAEALLPEFGETPEQILQIADLLARLEETNARWMRVVDARYFSGLTEEETAQALGLSTRTVRRDWKAARAWLAQEMEID